MAQIRRLLAHVARREDERDHGPHCSVLEGLDRITYILSESEGARYYYCDIGQQYLLVHLWIWRLMKHMPGPASLV